MVYKDDNIRQSNSPKKNHTLFIVAVISILILLFCGVRLVLYSVSSYYTARDFDDLRSMVSDKQSVRHGDEAVGEPFEADDIDHKGSAFEKYSELYKQNRDLAGWIKIDGTQIDYPVMQTVFDEEYYLHRGYDKSENDEGVPFMDIRCLANKPSTNILIYGHNMKNGHMFADLLKYEDEDFCREHSLIHFDTLYREDIYEVVAVFRTKIAYQGEDTFRYYGFVEADNEDEFNNYVSAIKELSIFETGITPVYGDYLLTLSTCEYTSDDGRFVVVARRR